jgi:hypothetical protein
VTTTTDTIAAAITTIAGTATTDAELSPSVATMDLLNEFGAATKYHKKHHSSTSPSGITARRAASCGVTIRESCLQLPAVAFNRHRVRGRPKSEPTHDR